MDQATDTTARARAIEIVAEEVIGDDRTAARIVDALLARPELLRALVAATDDGLHQCLCFHQPTWAACKAAGCTCHRIVTLYERR